MDSRLDNILLAFILLVMPIVLGIERFIQQTPTTQFITGILIGLTIVAGIVYTYRVTAQPTQKR
jgi:hypothetical protein